MKKSICFAAVLLIFGSRAFAVWDVTTPAGTESKSLGDDRIRELKTDIQTSLQYEGDFPGPDTSDPKFIYTPSTGTSAGRPTGDEAVAGRLYVNISSGVIEQYNGSTWNPISGNAPNTVTKDILAENVAGDGIVGGNGTALSLNVDTTTFEIITDTLTIRTGGINSSQILDGTLVSADFASDISLPGSVTRPSQPGFLAYNSTSDLDVTGNNTTVTIEFDTEVYDTASNFASNTFTAPVTGKYLLNASVNSTGGSGYLCEVHLVTSNRTYSQEFSPTSSPITFNISVIADMDANDTAYVEENCSGGAKLVDILGSGATTRGVGNPTFFSGTLLN